MRKMKIGILTFHYACNYGALFQAVSLFDYLASLGHEVYMIDYHNKEIEKSYTIYPSTASNKNFRFYLTLCLRILMRIIRFHNFRRFIRQNLKMINLGDIQSLDYIVVGSDQVWNTKLTNGYDSYYWGDFPFKGHIFSYAASMNAVALTDEDKKSISLRLSNFSSISVRERAMLQMLSPITEKNLSLVLDPTMLNDTVYWQKRCGKKRTKEKYILAYPLRDGNTVLSIAKAIADKLNCRLKIIKGDTGWNPFTDTYNTAGPQEVLALINGAEFIVTSSFHGTVLSILLKKQFYTIKCKDGNNVRTESILNLLQLKNRMIKNVSEIDFASTINYLDVEGSLNIEREKSRTFIKESLYE
jgi:hypothetical protein